MAHQPRRRTCQGDFAATVKEILPIDECNDVAASTLAKQLFGKMPLISGSCILTDRRAAA
jgi:hypothetical protein